MNESNKLFVEESLVGSKAEWSQPSLKRLSLKDAETAAVTFLAQDGVGSYS